MLSSLLNLGCLTTLEQLPTLIREQAGPAGLADVRIYLVDLQGQVLRELTGQGLDAGEGGETIPVDGTLAGRVFRDIHTLPGPAPTPETQRRYWTPVMDGTERLGVLSARLVNGEDEALAVLEDLAALVGLLLVSKREFSDSFARLVRTRPMTIATELQWHLMPPTSFANQDVVVGAAMEPAYEIGGDAFDYAMAAGILHLAVFDAMGHDASAGLAANLAVATCRNQRRQDMDLVRAGQEIERMLLDQFDDARYATAVLADLDTGSGLLSWVNHGHHPPVIVRGGRWVSMLSCPPAHPLGTDLGLAATVCREQLEPGDRLLFYTDGVIEARDPIGREFGLARFVDFVVRHHADGLGGRPRNTATPHARPAQLPPRPPPGRRHRAVRRMGRPRPDQHPHLRPPLIFPGRSSGNDPFLKIPSFRWPTITGAGSQMPRLDLRSGPRWSV